MISAVVISTVFLVISTTFLSYFGTESSSIVTRDEDYIFNNIKDQVNDLITIKTGEGGGACSNNDLNNFKQFVIEEYEKQGYIITLQATCSGLTVLTVKSDKVTIEYTT